MQRRISNVARDTVTQTSVADPRTDGWMRVGVGQCSFCQMLIGRGAVYTESTVNFGAHDHCKCQAAPAFPGKPPIDVAEYRASTRRTAEQKATENARAREWIANNL